jgi:hypothetical protein
MRRAFGEMGVVQARNGIGTRAARRAVWQPLSAINASSHARVWTKGVKTVAKVDFADLPQGPLPAKALETIPEHEGPAYPTVIQQARNNMLKFSHCVVLTRVGGFYEVSQVAICISRFVTHAMQLYFEQAEEYAPLLSIKLAKKKTNAGAVPMVSSLIPFCIRSKSN